MTTTKNVPGTGRANDRSRDVTTSRANDSLTTGTNDQEGTEVTTSIAHDAHPAALELTAEGNPAFVRFVRTAFAVGAGQSLRETFAAAGVSMVREIREQMVAALCQRLEEMGASPDRLHEAAASLGIDHPREAVASAVARLEAECAEREARGQEWLDRLPTFSAPTNAPVPSWATEVGGWEGPGGAEWVRDLRRPIVDGVELFACESFDGTSVKHSTPVVSFSIDTIDGAPAEIATTVRELATALHQVADILTGPPRRGDKGSAGGFQARICDRIRGAIHSSGLSQNALAVAAGYGVSELSEFMTGRLPMDMNDIERILTALGIDPFDFFAQEAR